MGSIPINIADHVGRTPMVQLARLEPEGGAAVFGKLEMFNPGGSVKDRIGVAMIEAAEKEGRIEPGRTTVVEATSGNTGIALAFVCAAKGYELILTLPQGMSREREGLLRLYGAQVHITESMGGMNEAVAAARAMARDRDVFLPDQFSNPANPEVHRRTTGPELWEALDGNVDYLVAGVGTGGTITGAGSFLKDRVGIPAQWIISPIIVRILPVFVGYALKLTAKTPAIPVPTLFDPPLPASYTIPYLLNCSIMSLIVPASCPVLFFSSVRMPFNAASH